MKILITAAAAFVLSFAAFLFARNYTDFLVAGLIGSSVFLVVFLVAAKFTKQA
ncbi:MAG: hypothetical protein KY442_03145 [Proteobacteria bacterium]|nr:hypothetical protein [Pseudomonadota bacterium]